LKEQINVNFEIKLEISFQCERGLNIEGDFLVRNIVCCDFS